MTGIDGVIVTPVDRHADERGYFSEIARFAGRPDDFSQANHSHSRRGVLRGLHYHLNQADLWYVVRGTAQVALADLRGGRGERTVATL
ncbi:MAG: dTDP-4-dehydrorhamnose 3,5-epimerase family protein, partial [Actinomycetota bacterium]|nr:dTDP-4-dehydrorhamnose 3,5-epimerase family protein [Actinomycetota bacterium]